LSKKKLGQAKLRKAEGEGIKQQAPNLRFQIPNKVQAPIPKTQDSKKSSLNFFFWRLDFVWDLVLGIWNLPFIRPCYSSGIHIK
jgi:hypothetical protein